MPLRAQESSAAPSILCSQGSESKHSLSQPLCMQGARYPSSTNTPLIAQVGGAMGHAARTGIAGVGRGLAGALARLRERWRIGRVAPAGRIAGVIFFLVVAGDAAPFFRCDPLCSHRTYYHRCCPTAIRRGNSLSGMFGGSCSTPR